MLNFVSYRLVGELAIISGNGITTDEYLKLTDKTILEHHKNIPTEYFFFRNAFESIRNGNNKDMISFLEIGRVKTVCWHTAVVESFNYLNHKEKLDIAVLSSQWKDIPTTLRSRLLTLI